MPLEATHFVDARTGWAVGDGGTVLATRDGGVNWQPQSSTTDHNLLSVYFIDAETGWAVGEAGTILSTHNGGVNCMAIFNTGSALLSRKRCLLWCINNYS
jgi:photosystem II stability/assembly factor-like uncharacterized protein